MTVVDNFVTGKTDAAKPLIRATNFSPFSLLPPPASAEDMTEDK